MENEKRKKVVNLYPSVKEILSEDPITRCDRCDRVFHNTAACRLHMLKQHEAIHIDPSNEKKLVAKINEESVVLAYHCPDALCSSKKSWFDGRRNLRQHYIRSHTEKKHVCEKCGYKTALEKDIKYHRKVRCSMLHVKEVQPKKDKITRKRKTKKQREADKLEAEFERKTAELLKENERLEAERRQYYAELGKDKVVLQPILLVVPADKVSDVVDNIQKAITKKDNNISQMISSMPPSYLRPEDISILSDIPSTSYNNFDNPSFCERGTMMEPMMNQETLTYFDPPFTDDTFQNTDKQDLSYDFCSGSLQPPQTRSFGTMFENPNTCNIGTSVMDDDYMSEFQRDTETQTPRFMNQQNMNNGQVPTDDWSWRMIDGDI